MLRSLSSAALSLTLLACAHGQGAPLATPPAPLAKAPELVAPKVCPALPALAEASSAQLIERFGTGLEPYQLEGGAWLAHAPVLVNQDFDFAIAMAMGPVGAGLAAGKRKQANAQRATELAGAQLSASTLKKLEKLRTQGTHVYFVLWGAEEAVLHVVIERDLTCAGPRETQVVEGPKASMPGGWSAPGTLDDAAQKLLPEP